jgi:segregation and condensation protein A
VSDSFDDTQMQDSKHRNLSPRDFSIRLEQFEGPLDLLLYLIQSQELDISTVSISKITDQYLNTVRQFQEMDFDIASEFLLMAATLILWKSKAILPREDDGIKAEDAIELPLTQEQLVRQLMIRQQFLSHAAEIAKRPFLNDDVFTRSNKRPPIEKIWKEMNVSVLATTYQDLLIREQRRARIVMKKETVSLAAKIQEFGNRLSLHQITALQSLVADTAVRGEWVVAFLASLELSRLKKIKIYQEQTFDPIYIEMVDTMINFDARQASGFSYVNTGVVANEPAPAPTPTQEPTL